MFKRIQGFIIGFISCAVILGGVAFAATELSVKPNPFPVLINGTETTVEGYNINGYTFLKLADFKKAGLTIKFNETDSRIEVTTTQNTQSKFPEENTATPEPMVTPQPVEQPPILDGISFVDKWEGKYYVSIELINKKIRPLGYDIYFYPNDKDAYMLIKTNPFSQSGRVGKLTSTDEILIENLPVYEHPLELEVDYYTSTILPLIK
jgi:hypothetical protein